MKARMNRLGFHKRSGTSAHELVYCLMIWVWLKVDSIGMFARESLQTFSRARADALYAALNQEDWNWRRLHMGLAQQAVRGAKTSGQPGAFVLDDSIRVRHGKRMPGVSSHFDRTSGRHVMGQQVLTLGIASAEGFVPIDSELFISATRAQGLHLPFRDGRSVAAKRYRVAQSQTKPQMAGNMIRRSQRAGIEADYLLADAWFGTKPMIRLADEQLLTPILRMKKNAMKYRLTERQAGQTIRRVMDVKALYQSCIRCRWQKIPGQPYQARALDVELNLSKQSLRRLYCLYPPDRHTVLYAGDCQVSTPSQRHRGYAQTAHGERHVHRLCHAIAAGLSGCDCGRPGRNECAARGDGHASHGDD